MARRAQIQVAPNLLNGRVYNYTGEILAVIHRDGSNRLGNILEDGQMTPSSIEPEMIFHLERDDHVIRTHHYGWILDPGCQTMVYRRSDGIVWFGPVEHDLHCIPTDITKLEPPYFKASSHGADGVAISLDNTWGEPAPAKGPHDGFNEIRWKNFYTFRESRRANYMRTGRTVTIRLKLSPYDGMSTADLNKVHQSIMDAMSLYWNTATIPTGSSDRMVFRVELVDEYEDHGVQLKLRGDPNKGPSSNSDEWWSDIMPGPLAHELGHVLGLRDEYYVFNRDEGARNPRKMTFAQHKAAEQADYPGRYERRVAGGQCSLVANVMEKTDAPVVVDANLIDSIFTASDKQVFCLR